MTDAPLASLAEAAQLDAARAALAQHGLCDLHIDTWIPKRLWGYDPARRHGLGLLRGHFFGHLDLPRLGEAGVRAAGWSLTTNPFRPAGSRWRTYQRNRAAFSAWIATHPEAVATAQNTAQALEILASGRHAVLPAVQGANAFSAAPDLDAVFADGWLTRATLVHLTDSDLGASSSPLSWRRHKGLSERGRQVIAAMDRHRVWLDLAHAHPQTFWDAVACHDRDRPLVATHTGVSGVAPHWRNLSDEQVRAIADSGGVVGIIAASNFLGDASLQALLVHAEHAIQVGGEAVAAIGTDLDGAIIPPRALRDGLGHLRLVAAMFARGWSTERIERVCAGNFWAAWRRLRG
ncbi:MAG: membrane dipeptidase [Deltaproteobacteria bacterium]|nr:membrane dipeptidase [Deltaproteobacteria bacterium]